MTFDWIDDFEKNFGINQDIREIKKNRFHGSIEINFCNGEPMNINIKKHLRAFTIQPKQGEDYAGKGQKGR